MDIEKVKKTKDDALNFFRAKDYKNAISTYKEIDLDRDLTTLFDKRNAVNTLFTSYSKLYLQNSDDRYFTSADKYCMKYLELAISDKNNLKSWAENILESFIGNLIQIYVEKFEDNQSVLKLKLESMLKRFIEIFEDVFEHIVFNQFILEIYKERQNYKDNRVHIKNAENLSEIFLELSKNVTNLNKERSSIYVLLSDLKYFSGESNKEVIDIDAIQYLNSAIKEDPNNRFANDRKSEISKMRDAREQISKFKHDAGSRLGLIKTKVLDLSKKYGDDSNILKINNLVDEWRADFSIVNGENPPKDDVDIKKLFLYIKDKFLTDESDKNIEIEFKIFGKKRDFVSNFYNLVTIFDNLIKNSIEAYSRNGINQKKVEISFDFDSFEFKIFDSAGGVKEEFLKDNQLFELYKSSKEIKMSSGFGLNNVKNSVERLGGEIKVESSNGCTTFTIKFDDDID